MNNVCIILVMSFIVSVLLTAIGLPAIIKACKVFGYYDVPDARKVHRKPVPRLGGLVFMPAAVSGLLTGSCIQSLLEGTGFSFGVSTLTLMCGVVVIYGVGIIDDRYGMKASHKFLIQIAAALILPLCNLNVTDLNGIFGLHLIPVWISYVLTVLLILTIVNAINLIDGIDGLSSGLCVLILSVYAYIFIRSAVVPIAVLNLAIIGSLMVFWCFNVFGKVGGMKIFMGDAGSLFLGYICAYMGVKSLMRPVAPVDCGEEQMLVSVSLLFIPVMDVIRVALQRCVTGHGMFEPDKTHIHHVLMNAGLSMHGALAGILSLFVAICVINYALWQCGMALPLIILMDMGIYGLVVAVGMLIKREG